MEKHRRQVLDSLSRFPNIDTFLGQRARQLLRRCDWLDISLLAALGADRDMVSELD